MSVRSSILMLLAALRPPLLKGHAMKEKQCFWRKESPLYTLFSELRRPERAQPAPSKPQKKTLLLLSARPWVCVAVFLCSTDAGLVSSLSVLSRHERSPQLSSRLLPLLLVEVRAAWISSSLPIYPPASLGCSSFPSPGNGCLFIGILNPVHITPASLWLVSLYFSSYIKLKMTESLRL